MININNYQATKETFRTGRQFLNETELNYQMTQNYFIQKKMAMLRMLSIKRNLEIQQVEEGLVDAMNNLINSKWQEINESVLKNVQINGGISGQYVIKEKTDWINIPSDLVSIIKDKADKNGNIFSILGLYYEQWLKETFSTAVVNTSNSAINNVLNDFLKSFSQTGARKTTSSLRQYSDIRPDLAVGIANETEKDGILYDSSGKLAVELQTKFNIQNYRQQKNLLTPEAIAEDTDILKEYIESGMFGFSVKRWTSQKSESRQLTSASGVQQIINTEYANSKNKTWNATFAYRKMVYIISKYLLDILGPVNVAFITGTSFIWTSDFLADALLTMNIYTKRMYANNEIKPYIQSGNIYVQHYKRGRKTAMLETRFSKSKYMSGKNKKSKKAWETFQVNFAINKK